MGDSDSRYSRRSFHDIIPIQGYLLIFGGLHNQNADSTSSLGQFASAGKLNYLTNHLGDAVISETKTLYLHKRDQSSVDSTSLLVQQNAQDIEELAGRITALESASGSNIVLLDNPVKVTSFTPSNNKYWGVEYNVDNSSYTMPGSPTSSDYKLPLDLSEVPTNAAGIILHVAATYHSNNNASTIQVFVSSTAEGGQNNTNVTDEILIYQAATSNDHGADIAFSGTIFLKTGQKVISNDDMTWAVSGYLI